MPLFDECCVLIPVSTLEDFPSDLSDYDARSLLAAWSVLWHPRLLAQTEQIPVWYRADAPPEPHGKRLFTAPNPSLSMLPDGYQIRADQSEESCWVTGDSRQEMCNKLKLEPCEPLTDGSRTVSEDDFYAAAYASLQIQVMTRRLRYTSNLDEIHLQNRLVTAAKAFLDGKASETIQALHDVFDSLSEERDHYFSSDPHLIDLVLTSESTLQPLLKIIAEAAASMPDSEPSQDPAVQTAPLNILVDAGLCQTLAQSTDPRAETLKSLLVSGKLGWAGGGPAEEVCLDAMTLAQAETVFENSCRQIQQSIGVKPPVYGRFAGTTPADITATLARLGYCGMIPIDFAGGRGFGDEAKVIMPSAAGDLEALTAKPIDASSDAAFLNMGAKLGEAIDSGEIATALLVHWPEQACDSFADLQRVASWSLSLGRFWKLDDYFLEGEHPYHNGNLSAASPDASEWLNTLVASGTRQPIESTAKQFRDQLQAEKDNLLLGMASLTSGQTEDAASTTVDVPGNALAKAMGLIVSEEAEDNDLLLLNPHSNGVRVRTTTTENPPAPAKHIFATSREGSVTETTVDVPACGFVVVRPFARGKASQGRSLATRLRKTLLGGGKKSIAEDRLLRNEFMEITLNADSGGISGIYSGGSRGNRFSMRLVRSSPLPAGSKATSPGDDTQMRCTGQQILTSNAAVGSIETSGEIIDGSSQAVLAQFTLRYTLNRGSRTLMVSGKINILHELSGEPWDNYYALRVAVAEDGAICRTLLRDKIHRQKSRRLVSPLGVLLDESERQTLVCSNGSAFHRRVGNRFLDTLVAVPGDTQASFSLQYGIDVPNPVNAARELLTGPELVAVKASQSAADIGWLMHMSPRDLLVSSLQVERRRDGRLAAVVRLIQTRSQQCNASLRFLRDVEAAFILTGLLEDPINHVLPAKEEAKDTEQEEAKIETDVTSLQLLKCEGDSVSLTLQSHATIEMLVIFASDASSA